MNFIDENSFLKKIGAAGIMRADDGALYYADENAVVGFDLTNLAPADSGVAPVDVDRQDRNVEYAMVSTLLKLVGNLELTPLLLYAADNEWADEDVEELSARKALTPEEANALIEIMKMERGMDVVVIDKVDTATAARILTPQFTVLGSRCFATNEKGEFLALFSQDDEVSFNTTDPDIYARARSFMMRLKGNLPFEIVWAEDYMQ